MSIHGWRPWGDRFRFPPGPAHACTYMYSGLCPGRPQSQPSPLRTSHGRPRVQGNFPTSPGQVPHGWPMVHHPIATGFPIPRGCCMALSVAQFSLLLFVRYPAMSRSPLPHSVTGPVPASHPSSRVYIHRAATNPVARKYLRVDRFVLLARVTPIPSPFFRATGFLIPRGCCADFATPPPSPHHRIQSRNPSLYPNGPPATRWRGPTGSSSIRRVFCAPCILLTSLG